jgi:hypothetical protein
MSADISEQINTFVQIADAVARDLRKKTGLPVAYSHVQAALQEAMGLERPEALLDHKWTRQRMLQRLQHVDFRKMFPQVMAEVRLPVSIVPPGTLRRIEEVTVRMNGEVWRIHKNDADPFPSNPHAHNVQSGLTMDLSTGELYLKRQPAGTRVSKKDLFAIRGRLTHVTLPALNC